MTHDKTKSENPAPTSPRDIATHQTASEESPSVLNLRQLSIGYMNEGFSIVDTNGVHVDVNPAFCQMTGFSAEELIGFSPHQLYWPPEEYERIQTAFAKTLRGEFDVFKLIFMRKDGERFPVCVHPFAIKSGTTLFLAATVKDMTRELAVERALRESEERYRGLFESAGDAIIILEDEKVIDCNNQTLELFDLASLDQLKSLSSFTFYPKTQPSGESSRAFAFKKLKKTYSGEPQFFEWTHVKRDGTTVNAEISLSSIRTGKKDLVQAIIRDVTKRKKVESELQDSDTRFRTLFQNAGDGIMILKDGQIIDCNDQAAKISGRSRDELMSNPTDKYFPPSQPNGRNSLEFFSEMVEAARAGNPQFFEWRDQRPDGTFVDIEVGLTTFRFNNEVYTQSILRDITERRRMENALSSSESRFRALFESSHDAIVIMDEEKIVDCNERTIELYGHSRDQILSTLVTDFFPPTQPNQQSSRQFFDERVKASRSGTPQVFEWTGRNQDGTPLISEITLTSVIIDKKHYTQSIVRDITQRKQLEAALVDINKTLEDRVMRRTLQLEMASAELQKSSVQYRALAAKLAQAENDERKRIAQLLHDNHQQLLVAAKLNVEMLTTESYDAEVNRTARHVLEILNQAADITRSLTMDLAPPILYVSGLVSAIQRLARWMKENHQLEVNVSGSLSFIPIQSDLGSILLRSTRELLFNVIKHSGVNQAHVNVTLADQRLQLTVTDDGAGFDVSDSLGSAGSFGLLSIQEQLTVINGRMDIVSGLERGTTVTLSISMAPAPVAATT